MSQPEVFADAVKLQDFQKELDTVTAEHEQAENDWTEQAEQLENLD